MIEYMQSAVAKWGEARVQEILNLLHNSPCTVADDQHEMRAFGLHLISDERRALPNTEHGKNMPYLWDEQPLTWMLLAPFVLEAVVACEAAYDFIDIGVGTAPFACWAASLPEIRRVLGIDANPRALRFAEANVERNGLTMELRQQWVEPGVLPNGCAKAIGIWPPYTPYPSHLERFIPLHARGGCDTQDTWRSQIKTAFPALAESGALIFNQCAPGGPAWHGCQAIAEIADLAPGASVVWTEVYEPISAAEFIRALYDGNEPTFQEWWTQTYTTHHYILGAIINDGQERRERFTSPVVVNPDGWYTGRIPCFQDVMAVTWDRKRKEESGE